MSEKTFIVRSVDRHWGEIALWHLRPLLVDHSAHVLKAETGSWETVAVSGITTLQSA